MATAWLLRKVEDQLTKDLKETTVTFQILARKYGVSKQAISLFCQRKGINRPKRMHTETCSICRDILRIARQEHSDFISSRTIKKQLRVKAVAYSYHVKLLRRKRLVSNRFGKLRSKRLEQAYKIYFGERLPARTIAGKMGPNSFGSSLRRHKASGWDVPAPLFIYAAKAKRANLVKVTKRKKRSRTVRKGKS